MKVLAAMFAAVVLLAAAPAAWACSCMRYADPAAHVAATDVIFVGRVVGSKAEGPDRMATTFTVSERLKGTAPGRVRVRHAADVCCICGMTYQRGARVLVFAHRDPAGQLATSSCSAPRFTEAQYRAVLQR